MLAGVKGLTPVLFGLVFGRGLGGCRQAENRLQSGKGVGGQSGVQVAGQSGVFIGWFSRIPGAMGQPGARCREWAFDFGCPNK